MRAYIVRPLIIAITVLALLGGLPRSTARAGSGVTIANFAFAPGSITVAPGTTVTWTNTDSVAHTVTADDKSWGSGSLSKNATYSFSFTQPGTYTYHCSIHPDMTGTIIVSGTAPTPGPASPTPVATLPPTH